MAELACQRCTNHAHREAVALCPGCHHAFCRECVTEHDDRLLCAACLAGLVPPTLSQRLRLAAVGRLALLLLSFLVLWMCFFLWGKTLLAIPSAFHEGTYLTQWNSEP